MFELRDAQLDDVPHLAEVMRRRVPDALAEYRGDQRIMVATREGMLVGLIIARIDGDRNELTLRHLYTMRHFRRLGIARALWGRLFAALPLTWWRCEVDEYNLAAQMTLKAFGFRCVKSKRGTLKFVRR